jgi:DNA-binding response OmpR family regulator
MKKILLLEDDHSLGPVLKERLSKTFSVVLCQTIQQAKLEIKNQHFDLAILDVGLPDGSGFEVAAEIKKISKVPILFLTAQSDAENRLKGYELGAEEYIPKPFHLKELLIRIEHVLQSHPVTHILKLPECEIHFSEMKIKKKSGEIEFPAAKDLQVLELLVKKSPEAVSRDEILNTVWGPEKDLNFRTIDNTIVRLKKLISDDQDQFIRSVRGIGYQWIFNQENPS